RTTNEGLIEAYVHTGGGLFQVNDVYAVALGEDVALHPGMPPAGLVPKVGSGF
ncbi:unnamed protein product, partial [marine sediment metagenome]